MAAGVAAHDTVGAWIALAVRLPTARKLPLAAAARNRRLDDGADMLFTLVALGMGSDPLLGVRAGRVFQHLLGLLIYDTIKS
jgi:hypothetical protein